MERAERAVRGLRPRPQPYPPAALDAAQPQLGDELEDHVMRNRMRPSSMSAPTWSWSVASVNCRAMSEAIDVPGSKRTWGRREHVADDVRDRHRLAEGAAEADEHGADDAADGVAQADLAGDLPRGGAHAVAGLLDHGGHHAQHVARDRRDERQDHEREHDARREDADADALDCGPARCRGCCPAVSSGSTARRSPASTGRRRRGRPCRR